MKTLIEVLKLTTRYLEDKGFGSASRLEAERMLAAVAGTDRLGLYLQFDRPLAEPELERLRAMLRRRAAHEPLQYIIGETAFREIKVRVGPGVLVPRPETEGLVQIVLDWIDHRREAKNASSREFRIFDLCCGSGAAGLSAAWEANNVTALLSDISIESLKYASENLKRCREKLGGRVILVCSDLFSAIRTSAIFEVVIANPPYVSTGELQALPNEVRLFEPRRALEGGGSSGTDTIERIVAAAPDYLVQGGLLALEIGETQQEAVSGIFEKYRTAYSEYDFQRDLNGKTRYFMAVRADRNQKTGIRSQKIKAKKQK